MADLFLFPSYREGLSLALLEAMVNKLPVICSDNRGNCDLVDDGWGGYRLSEIKLTIESGKLLLKICFAKNQKDVF